MSSTPASAATGSMPTLPGMAPPPTPQLPEDRINPEDVAKASKRKAVDEALVQVREAFYKQDWDSAKAALLEAEKVDPAAPQLQVYRSLLARKLAESAGQVAPSLRTPRPGVTPVAEVATPATHVTATPEVTPTPELRSVPTANVATPVTEQPVGTTKTKKLLRILGLAAIAAVLWFAFRALARKKPAAAPAPAAPSTGGLNSGFMHTPVPVERTPAPPPPPMMFQNLEDQATIMEDQQTLIEGAEQEGYSGFTTPRPLREDVPQDAQSVAQAIAKNLETFKPPVPEAAPAFDVFVSGENTNYDDAMTAAEATQGPGAPLIPSGIFAAPPKPETPKPAAPKAAAPAEAEKASDTVSFEDLGISFGPSEPPASPPPAAPAAPASPAPSAAAPAPAPPAAPTPAVSNLPVGGAIKLDDLTVATPPKPVATPAPPLNVSGAIDLQAVLFGDKSAPSAQASSPAPAPAAPAPAAPEPAPIVLPSLEDFMPAPPPSAPSAPAPDETYGALADTFHSQETIGLSDQTKAIPEDSQRLDGTVGFGPSHAPIDPALAATKTASSPTPVPQESFYGEAPKSGSQIDERSEKMFKEQYERAQRAVKEKNWRQAVHYLSIAAAIHPENEQVREQLKTARAEKRKQEVGA